MLFLKGVTRAVITPFNRKGSSLLVLGIFSISVDLAGGEATMEVDASGHVVQCRPILRAVAPKRSDISVTVVNVT